MVNDLSSPPLLRPNRYPRISCYLAIENGRRDLGLHIKNDDFPQLCKRLQEGISYKSRKVSTFLRWFTTIFPVVHHHFSCGFKLYYAKVYQGVYGCRCFPIDSQGYAISRPTSRHHGCAGRRARLVHAFVWTGVLWVALMN